MPKKKVTRTRQGNGLYEKMEVEFIGGPFDGTRLFLPVMREGPGHIRVLQAEYYEPTIAQDSESSVTTH